MSLPPDRSKEGSLPLGGTARSAKGAPLNQGRFITLEGIDGAGKSTQLAALVAFLQQRGVDLVQTREPGGTPLGETLRALLLHEAMHPDTEAMLMFAARREHLAEVIEPALAAGRWVVCDRFSDATFAYQGAGRGLPLARLEVLEQWTHGSLQPDLTLLFDLPEDVAAARVQAGRDAADRFEQEQQAFFARVRAGYLARAAADPGRFLVLDAGRAPEEIQQSVQQAIVSKGFFDAS